MISIRSSLVLAALLLAAEVASFCPSSSRTTVLAKQSLPQSTSWLTPVKMSTEEEPEESPSKPEKPVPDPMPPAEMMSTPSSPRPVKRLDPLVASLTRRDAAPVDPNAPTTSIPLLGEVALDKNLFIVVPIVVFAFLGFFSFILVAANSGDEFVQALNDWNDTVLNPPAPAPLAPGECRGLCSSQEQDIEGLRQFMTGISGKK